MQPKLQALLLSLEKNREIYWNIPRTTAQFLYTLIRCQNFQTVLEIGTSTGYSALWMAAALSHSTKGHLYTIESHRKERQKLAEQNFAKSGLLKHITLIRGHAPEDLPKTPRAFDMAFLDATKHEHPSYFQALKSRIKKGGLIISDNLNSHRKKLTPYVKTIQAEKYWRSTELNLGTGLHISQKVF